MNITKLNRNDAGIYTCEAVNSQGSVMINITVVVECKYTRTHTSHLSKNLLLRFSICSTLLVMSYLATTIHRLLFMHEMFSSKDDKITEWKARKRQHDNSSGNLSVFENAQQQ